MNKPNRNKAYALLGLGCVLVLLALLLPWRRGSQSTSPIPADETRTAVQPRTAATDVTPPPQRVVRFPEDQSLGELVLADWRRDFTSRGSAWDDLTLLGEAQGDVVVPAGKLLGLSPRGIFSGRVRIEDLSPLADLEEHALDWLDLFAMQAKIDDDDLAHISGMKSLGRLSLEWTAVSDDGLAHLKRLTSLQWLTLSHTSIGDVALAHIRDLKSIRQLDLRETDVTDMGLEHLNRMTSLRALDLRDTGIGDEGLARLSGLTSIEVLNIIGTRVTDKGLVHLHALSNLQHLYLSAPHISPGGVGKLKQTLPDCRIIRYDRPAQPNLKKQDPIS